MAFPLAYAQLTLTHFKGQGYGYANFDSQYLANGDR